MVATAALFHSSVTRSCVADTVTPVVKQDMTKDIAHVVMRDSEALSVLYGVWGYGGPSRFGLVRSGSKSGAGM